MNAVCDTRPTYDHTKDPQHKLYGKDEKRNSNNRKNSYDYGKPRRDFDTPRRSSYEYKNDGNKKGQHNGIEDNKRGKGPPNGQRKLVPPYIQREVNKNPGNCLFHNYNRHTGCKIPGCTYLNICNSCKKEGYAHWKCNSGRKLWADSVDELMQNIINKRRK